MYATAHRVVSARGETGINAFLHLHGLKPVPGIDWNDVDMDFVTDRAPGAPHAEHLEVTPGGNRVLSYLAVVCRDDTPNEAIVRALAHMEATLELNTRPVVRRFPEGVTVRFDFAGQLPSAEQMEFKTLREVLAKLVIKQEQAVWITKAPLRIGLHVKEGEYVFRLDDKSRRRVAEVKDLNLPLAIIHVEVSTYQMFDRLYGDLIRQILPALTGLTLDQIRNEGGVTLVLADTGRILWEWPRRTQALTT
ncbi:MAG: hypothetical protein HN396_15000 [Gemmatimonadales bacterium]|jgi:hypothetical protein|nr:hypothetical protein [Gemmatimonadales bacterium]